jgi:hypothetical protein
MREMKRVLAAAVVITGLALIGCKSDADHPHGDHPKADHPKADHPDHPKTDHPKADHPK